MVVISPMGGHGSVFLSRALEIRCRRPDVAFGLEKDITDVAVDKYRRSWDNRTRMTLKSDATIEWNLLNAIRVKPNVLLGGICSIKKPFLTRNKIKAFCFVRHPVHAYVSLLKNQHPGIVKKLKGFNTEEAVDWWCWRWNAIVEDFLSSGNEIYRFEFMPEEIKDEQVRKKLKGWDPSRRNYGQLSGWLETKMKMQVEEKFYRIYDSWRLDD